MRAAWIATVSNIDWPSKKGLSSETQQEEIVAMLDQFVANKMNAVIFQIRPTSDALFPSTLEPWSHWLTGEQGVAPTPYYDPLQFMIDEAHKRCIDVHVWLNPYRVANGFDTAVVCKDHLFRKRPELFVTYGGQWYFDPGYDETRAWLNKVVADLVQRYDIDAVHFDDYFYPYKVKGKDFPDTRSFAQNPRGYTTEQKDDWRRNNVNLVIAELQQTIKSLKPWVEFGISPFGVWRNKENDTRGSDTKAGVQNYDDLYADILKWLDEGNIDYVVPQLYWEIGKEVADYEVLAKWWSENSYGKNLYIGLYTSKLGMKGAVEEWHRPNELARQLTLNKRHKEIDGAIHFSAKGLMHNLQGINDSLQNNFYRYPALCPINRNIKGGVSIPPKNIRAITDREEAVLMWEDSGQTGGYKTAYYVVYAFKGKHVGDLNDPRNIVCRTTDTFLDVSKYKGVWKGYYTFVVTSINKYKCESIPTFGVAVKM